MFKHLKMNRVTRQDGTNLRLDLGYTRQQIIDYINEEAQKVVDTSFGSDESINTSGIITATRFIGDGSLLTGIVATGTGVEVRDSDTIVGSGITYDQLIEQSNKQCLWRFNLRWYRITGYR